MQEESYYKRTKREKALVRKLAPKIIVKFFNSLDFKIISWSHKHIGFSHGTGRYNINVELCEEVIHCTLWRIHLNERDSSKLISTMLKFFLFELKPNDKLSLKGEIILNEDSQIDTLETLMAIEQFFVEKSNG
ncbi:hypothetical protein J7E79_03975 [Bacillus sp. ISL-40]|uniref:hypothetical protein n=1 Tax=unclassified Bacillus (in: firmicutes) TaxID=185979 RepID=UPI001BE65943|nr:MULTISPECIES: hypothetical protein [unclassified Bacillus (in: firmicutes)]MBT2696581.1 hypothetical protein [Bacillus sp. ISL-40]MBT2723742.1 hypothetical protein [Bacillus sp. ISL-46]